ncbi:hypothetical protein J3L18_12195 [Mucilaginibacter gossypii]|uniref:hypothetical protein n=1 Tax=Mucilaginibacter gossypii TaxID=551996 RepID=UPI000DCE6A46|nr:MULTISPECIES: hypothetical protein [Mucilaginibacter]QTE39774.1 hypothetical protein J3L18_12195 [Mucilaginibacter gossypii]RAV54154.1 hypothetical protein DIU36_21225 [Mucilaginibacter rubeus]
MNSLPIRWENITLGRVTPHVYPRYYRRKEGFAQLAAGHHFFIDEKHSWCEVFYERIDFGFWLVAMEIHVKSNNHYILEAKRHSPGLFSINFFSSAGRIGYLNNQDVHWADNQVVFSGPGTVTEIYAEKGKVLKCCRLIFTGSYLTGLSNTDNEGLGDRQTEATDDRLEHSPLFRVATRAEVFLQDRLFNILRYERKKYHYKSSIFSILFELTAFFLGSLWMRKVPPMYQ